MSDARDGWFVYVLLSRDARRTYVGISTDPERRLAQHNGERTGGARSTRAGRPWTRARLHGPYACQGDALRVERALKKRRGDARLLPLDDGGVRVEAQSRPSAQNSTPV